MAVKEHSAFGGDRKCPLYESWRDSYTVAILYLDALLLEKLEGLRLEKPDASAFQDFEAGVVQSFHLGIG
jgi:hypothetical protein